MANLFSNYNFKSLNLKNSIVLPPMCQFAVDKNDGIANQWHYVHYVSKAIGGVGLIIIEMTNIEPNGRITDNCLGLWDDKQIPMLQKIVKECQKYGSKVAVQIGHAGRKAQDTETPVSSSPVRFDEKSKIPHELSTLEAYEIIEKYRAAISRAVEVGFDAIEIHGAHGYLIHQFHSPITNKRTDEFGKDLSKFGVEIIRAAKSVTPDTMPLIFRISAIEYVQNGYGLDYSIELCKKYKSAGVDIFHVSSGGEGPLVGSAGKPGSNAGYQVEMANVIKTKVSVPVIAVGRLENPQLANYIIESELVDLVAVGRGLLRNSNWPIEAAIELNQNISIPPSIKRGFPKL